MFLVSQKGKLLHGVAHLGLCNDQVVDPRLGPSLSLLLSVFSPRLGYLSVGTPFSLGKK